MSTESSPLVVWLTDVSNDDVQIVGGKNASLGEMIGGLRRMGIQVPEGFATTAEAYRRFVDANDLEEQIRSGDGESIRAAFKGAELPDDLGTAIAEAYTQLGGADVAVRSSATAEDLPDASFAGQQETFLNVRGESELMEAVRNCFASLFTDRAIAYREEKGFDHLDVALSVGVQRMVRSDEAGAGVLFTLDPETGFPLVVVIEAAWGLGESVVAGTVNPDHYTVFKPLLDDPDAVPIIGKDLGEKATKVVYADNQTETIDTPEDERDRFVLSDDEVLQLARWGVAIERHYGRPMDVEWAKDGRSGELFIVQARPETVHSADESAGLRTFTLRERGEVLVSGLAIGDSIAAGTAIRVREPSDDFEDGAILVTEMTDPDWVPLMRRAAAIVTDLGGRTAHAAIVSRELGVPAIVGTGDATSVLAERREVTVSCVEDDEGRVYDGILEFSESEIDLADLPEPKTAIMLNIASTLAAFRWWRLPAKGIGLARMEFVVNSGIQTHPLALTRFDELSDEQARASIEELTRGYQDKREYFVDRLARGLASIGASQYPHPVIVRMSDFKTNEYADLIGGRQFEPEEANPMLGFRGASRYYSDSYRDGFVLECQAIRRVRDDIGLRNVKVMIPFVRTLGEADRVLEILADQGLVRGVGGLEVYMMVEIPSNVVLAEEFARRFDGFSIGSNDLTQLVLGIDRDSGELADLFDERDEAVKRMIQQLIADAHAAGIPVGICGQGPSDHPDFAAFLVEAGIDSISLNPDSVVETVRLVADLEARLAESR